MLALAAIIMQQLRNNRVLWKSNKSDFHWVRGYISWCITMVFLRKGEKTSSIPIYYIKKIRQLPLTFYVPCLALVLEQKMHTILMYYQRSYKLGVFELQCEEGPMWFICKNLTEL